MQFPFLPYFFYGPWVWMVSFLFVTVGIPGMVLIYRRKSKRRNDTIDEIIRQIGSSEGGTENHRIV